MSARIPEGYAEIAIQFGVTTDPEPMFTFLGVQLAAGVIPSQGNTDTIMGVVLAALDNSVIDDYTLGPGFMIWGDDAGDLRIDAGLAPVPGLNTGDTLPQNCAVLVRKLTALGGRRNRGRMFIPGVDEVEVVTNGLLTTAARTAWQTSLDALRTNLIALAEVSGVVLFHDSAPFTPTDITALEVQQQLATQRRRMRP